MHEADDYQVNGDKMGGWLISSHYPRKLRLLHRISLSVAGLLIAYVLVLAVVLPNLSTPPSILLWLQEFGCRNDFASFCDSAARQTPMGIIAPSADALGFIGTFFILPLGPLFLLTRSRSDGDEVNRFIDRMEDYQRRYRGRSRYTRHGFYTPRVPIFAFVVAGTFILISFQPSLAACHVTSGFRARLLTFFFRLCPDDTPIHALIVPVLYGLFHVTWSVCTYCWRPFRYWRWLNAEPQESGEEDEPGRATPSTGPRLSPPLPEPAPLRLNPPAKPAVPSFGKRTTPIVEKPRR